MINSSDSKGQSNTHGTLEGDIFHFLQRVVFIGLGALFFPTFFVYQVIKSKPEALLARSKRKRKKESLVLMGFSSFAALGCYLILDAIHFKWTSILSCFLMNGVGIGFLWFGAEWILYGFKASERLRVDDLHKKVTDFSSILKSYHQSRLDSELESDCHSKQSQSSLSTDVEVGISPVTNKVISISERSRNMHCLFAGGSGFGKTTLLKTLLIHAISKKQPCVIIDAKGSQGNIDEIKKFAEVNGLPSDKFYVFSISNPKISDSYNPIKNGSIVDKQDRLFSALEWSEIFYGSQATAYLSRLMPILDFFNLGKINLGDVREFMTEGSYRARLTEELEVIYKDVDCPADLHRKIAQIKTELNELEKWDSKVLSGLKAQLTTIDKESYGFLFRPKNTNETILNTFQEMKAKKGESCSEQLSVQNLKVEVRKKGRRSIACSSKNINLDWEMELLSKLGLEESNHHVRDSQNREIDLKNVMLEGGLVYFQLSSMSVPDSARRIGRLILEDLKWLATEINSKKVSSPSFFPIFIDEFGEFASEEFPVFLEQCREAKMGLHLFFQGIGNLKHISPDFADRMIESTAVKGILSTSSPEGVDVWAAVAGTVDALENSRQVSELSFLKIPTGMGNQRETKQMIVEHDVFRRLRPGQMILIDKLPEFHVELVQVWNPSEEKSLTQPNADPHGLIKLGSHQILRVGKSKS